jgi:hypothetical protein
VRNSGRRLGLEVTTVTVVKRLFNAFLNAHLLTSVMPPASSDGGAREILVSAHYCAGLSGFAETGGISICRQVRVGFGNPGSDLAVLIGGSNRRVSRSIHQFS